VPEGGDDQGSTSRVAGPAGKQLRGEGKSQIKWEWGYGGKRKNGIQGFHYNKKKKSGLKYSRGKKGAYADHWQKTQNLHVLEVAMGKRKLGGTRRNGDWGDT